MRSLLKQRKSQIGLDTVKGVVVALLVLGVLAVATILALSSLRDSNVFTSGSREYNSTSSIINNISDGTTDFFGNIPTIFAILVVVVIIAAIAIVIAVVQRFGGTTGI